MSLQRDHMRPRPSRRKRRRSAPKHKPKPWQTPKAIRMRKQSSRGRRAAPKIRMIYNEGRVAAIMGDTMCPYVLPESRRQWQAGFREQMENNGPG